MKPPSSPLPRVRRWAARLAAVLALAPLAIDCGIRQDELDCEEAVSYLQGCCPDFGDATISCTYSDGDGCVPNTGPALSIDDSQCIVAESCAQIVASGLCDKVKNLGSPMSDSPEPTGARVCP